MVIDWNNTYGPYETESHAWGYRWSGTRHLSDAIDAICAAGPLQITTAFEGAFVWDAFYYALSIDGDNHTSAPDWSGWWWAGETADGGQSWTGNDGGITEEVLGNLKIEGLNVDEGAWTGESLTIPIPEPGTLVLLLLGSTLAGRRKR
jgi:hypothetical protein